MNKPILPVKRIRKQFYADDCYSTTLEELNAFWQKSLEQFPDLKSSEIKIMTSDCDPEIWISFSREIDNPLYDVQMQEYSRQLAKYNSYHAQEKKKNERKDLAKAIEQMSYEDVQRLMKIFKGEPHEAK